MWKLRPCMPALCGVGETHFSASPQFPELGVGVGVGVGHVSLSKLDPLACSW